MSSYAFCSVAPLSTELLSFFSPLLRWKGDMRSAWCWSARQNRFRDTGGTEQCHHHSLKPLRLWNNLSPSALSEVIRDRTDSGLMGRTFSSATLGAIISLTTAFLYLTFSTNWVTASLFLWCTFHISFSWIIVLSFLHRTCDSCLMLVINLCIYIAVTHDH